MAGSGKAVPSIEFVDLKENMPNFDAMVNSTELTFTNRESPNGNVTSRTIAGINADADSAIGAIGGVDIGFYNTDPIINEYNQFVKYDRAGTIETYKPKLSTPLPYQINSGAIPDPLNDINLQLFNDVTKSYVNANADLHDTLAGAKSRTDLEDNPLNPINIIITDLDNARFKVVSGLVPNDIDIYQCADPLLQLELIDNILKAKAAHYGLTNSNDGDRVQRIFDKITSGEIRGVDFGSVPFELEKAVTVRREKGFIIANKSKMTLTSNTAGFRIFGDSFETAGFDMVQSDNALFCAGIIYANDATTPRTNYGFVHDCTSENVWRPLDFFFDNTIGGASALRHTVRQCRFLNFYLQGTWVNSFGVRFSGTTAGNGAGNDSVLDRVYCKGYLDNFNIENSVVTTLLACSGDGAGSCIRYGAGSDNLRIIGGYYEFNQNWMAVVGAKFDLYLFYPNIAQTVGDILTGPAIANISGGVPVGIAFNGIVKNGAFITGENGETEIYGVNDFRIYNGVGKTLRASIVGDALQVTGRILADTISSFTGGGTPLSIITGGSQNVAIGTNNTARFEVANTTGELAPAADATYDIGRSNRRVNTIYLVNSPSVTSDENLKTELLDVSEAEKRVAKSIVTKRFKYLEAIELKGEDKARSHFGFGAQSIIAAFKAEGLDALKYACVRIVSWDDEYHQPTEKFELEKEDGTTEILIREVGDKVLVKEKGWRYEIVIDEILALKMAVYDELIADK